MNRLKAAALITLTLAGATFANAQWVRRYVTIQGAVGEAETVCRGSIQSFKVLGGTPDGPYLDKEDYFELTIKVDEMLKGERKRSLVVPYVSFLSSKLLNSWIAHKTEFLWFSYRRSEGNQFNSWWESAFGSNVAQWLGPGSKHNLLWEEKRLSRKVEEESSYYEPDGDDMMSMDLTTLTKSEDIVSAARSFAKRYHAHVETFEMGIPSEVVAHCGRSDGAPLMALPICAEVNDRLRAIIESPEGALLSKVDLSRDVELIYGYAHSGRLQTLPSNEEKALHDAYVRYYRQQMDEGMSWDAILGLSHFKSAPNIDLLKKCLNNPSPKIRGAALEVLKGWGVDPNTKSESTARSRHNV